MNFKVLFLGLPLLTALAASSCNVAVHDHSIEDGEACRGICEPYCEYFVSCGAITTAEGLVACEDSCRRSYDSNPDATAESTACVQMQACRVAGESQCGGPVVPIAVGSGGAGGSTKGVGGASAAGGSAPVGVPASDSGAAGAGGTPGNGGGAAGAAPAGRCVENRDCALSEDCVAGTCLARCNASCECRSDEQCESGYCHPSTSARITCQRDCDCPASQHCTTGFCQ